jgi:outer membrane protein
MKMRRTLLSVGCFLVLVSSCFAQVVDSTGNTKQWTLRECVDFALANNLDIERAKYNVESSEVNRHQARMAMLPNLNGSASENYNWGRNINPVTNDFVTTEVNSLNLNANSQVTLFNGFRIQNTIKQNSRDLDASRFDLEKAKNDVTLNVINLYINAIFNKELRDNARFQLASSQQQLDRTRKQVAAGALPKSEELNLDAQVATNEVNLITNQNALDLSVLQLKQALQLPAATPFDIVMPELAAEDIAIDQTREQIFDHATETMPEVKAARSRVQSAFYAVKASKGNLYPRLNLNASIGTQYSSFSDRERFVPNGTYTRIPPQDMFNGPNQPTPSAFYQVSPGVYQDVFSYIDVPNGVLYPDYGYRDQLQDNLSRSVGLSLSIPVFNGFQARAGIRRSVIQQRLAEVNVKQVNNTLRQNIETAYNDAFAASKTFNSSQRQVQAREEAFRMTKQRYDIGASNYVEYQVAENELFRAKSDLARAKYNFIFRKKLLDFYQGKPIGL